MTIDSTCEEVLVMAARDETLPDDAFVMVRRALAGLDPVTGERPAPSLPQRMVMRGWRKNPCWPVETGRADGWYWRCPRRSCRVWGGPFGSEFEAARAGSPHSEHVPSAVGEVR